MGFVGERMTAKMRFAKSEILQAFASAQGGSRSLRVVLTKVERESGSPTKAQPDPATARG